MPASSPFTVLLDSRVHYTLDEGVVGATPIYPGMLIVLSSGLWIPSGTAVDPDAPCVFAIEDPKFNGGIDTAYAAGSTLMLCYPQGGARVYAFIETGANVAAGAALQSNGAGFLEVYSTGGRVLMFAEEAVNNSGGGSGPSGSARIRARKA